MYNPLSSDWIWQSWLENHRGDDYSKLGANVKPLIWFNKVSREKIKYKSSKSPIQNTEIQSKGHCNNLHLLFYNLPHITLAYIYKRMSTKKLIFGVLKLDTGQKKIFPELTFSPQIPSPLFRLDLAELIGKSQRGWLFKNGRKCKTSHLIQQSFQGKIQM